MIKMRLSHMLDSIYVPEPYIRDSKVMYKQNSPRSDYFWRNSLIMNYLFALQKNMISGFKLRVRIEKLNFLISQPKHMLWVLGRTVSMRRFF